MGKTSKIMLTCITENLKKFLNKNDNKMFRGTLVRKAGANKSASRDDGSGDVMDERLKNIEQKMVELIMSEV